jgi:glycerophosphoryl diester phosphodiesterase
MTIRGSAAGMMRTLGEVLRAFSDECLLVDVKTNDPEEANRLVRYPDAISDAKPERLVFDGGWRPTDRLRELRSEWVDGLLDSSR